MVNWLNSIIKAGSRIKAAIRKRATKEELAKSNYVSCCKGLVSKKEIASNYPPYNIVKTDNDDGFIIEIAAAGFTEDEFNIHVVPEGNKLVVQGVQDRGEDKQEYYHKGIAARNFTRTFALAERVNVQGAKFVNGMLLIELQRIVPEELKPIEIKVVKGEK